METGTITASGGPASVSAGGIGSGSHPYTRGCSCGRCEAKRSKWRDKSRAAHARKSGGVPPVPPPPGVSPAPAVGGQPPAAVDPAGPVPWTADLLRPIFGEVVPAVERARMKSRLSLAEKVGPEAVEVVKEKGGWPEPAKLTVINSGSRCAAKWLNKSGLSAEYSDEVALVGAIAAIAAGDRMVDQTLRKLIADKEEQRKRDAAAIPKSETMIHGASAN